MTNEEKNIAIAEACGWERGNSSLQKEWLRPSRKEHRTCISSWVTVEGLPDYCNDLNAMHEAEKYLMDESSVIYKEELEKVSCIWHSTAKQKAIAFLKAKGKWKE